MPVIRGEGSRDQLGPTSAAAWVLALAFLVVTLEAPLVYPCLSYMRHAWRMHALKPHLDAIQQRYSRDRDRYAAEVEKLYRANRVNTLRSCAGCLTLGCLWGIVPISAGTAFVPVAMVAMVVTLLFARSSLVSSCRSA